MHVDYFRVRRDTGGTQRSGLREMTAIVFVNTSGRMLVRA